MCTFSGATYCQLMHILFPTSIDLSSVRFESDSIEDYRHNYSLLQKAFDQVGVLRVSILNSLVDINNVLSQATFNTTISKLV